MSRPPFEYMAGVCNIDAAGVRFRRRLGTLSCVAGVASLVVMNYIELPTAVRIIITAGFGFATALNIYEANEQFCVFNATVGTMEIERTRIKIANDLYKELDRKKRNEMLLRTAIITVLSGLLGAVPF